MTDSIVTKPINKIKINLDDNMTKLLNKIVEEGTYSTINPYINEMIIDGYILDKDAENIDDYIVDWLAENQGQSLPMPLVLIQKLILGNFSNSPNDFLPAVPNLNTQYPSQDQLIEIDPENVPSYLNSINGLIEKEVRRRVKIEMKDHAILLRKYDELKKKFEGISKLFNVE